MDRKCAGEEREGQDLGSCCLRSQEALPCLALPGPALLLERFAPTVF